MATVNVKGTNVLDENQKAQALQKLADNLSAKELKNIASLCDNAKAKAYFSNDVKFNMLKTLVK